MALYIVGSGLSSDYLTLRALQVLGAADTVYVDSYTSIAPGVDEEFVRRLNPRCRVIRASRRLLEEEQDRIIEEARERNVVVLVPGDPFTATTHVTLRLAAAAAGVRVEIVYGVSGVYAVIGVTGLQFYRFGKPVTLVYPEGFKPYSVIDVIRGNRERGLHTLVLLDLRLDEGRAMTLPEAAGLLLELARETGYEELGEALVVGVARAGLPDEKCVAGSLERIRGEDWPPPPHSLVVTAPRLHPIEEDALKLFCQLGE